MLRPGGTDAGKDVFLPDIDLSDCASWVHVLGRVSDNDGHLGCGDGDRCVAARRRVRHLRAVLPTKPLRVSPREGPCTHVPARLRIAQCTLPNQPLQAVVVLAYARNHTAE